MKTISAILATSLLASAAQASFVQTWSTFIDTAAGDSDTGTITFDQSGLAGVNPSDITAIDLCFTYGVVGELEYSVTEGTAADLIVDGEVEIEFSNFSFGTTPNISDITEIQSTGSLGSVAAGAANSSGSLTFNTALGSVIDVYSINDVAGFLAGSQTIDYDFGLSGAFDTQSESNPFFVSFGQEADYQLSVEAKYTIVPEPTSGLLFGIGMALLLRRRR